MVGYWLIEVDAFDKALELANHTTLRMSDIFWVFTGRLNGGTFSGARKTGTPRELRIYSTKNWASKIEMLKRFKSELI